MARAKLVEIEATIQLLKQQIDAGLCPGVEQCLRGYVNWQIQTTKWTKLDLMEGRLKELGASGAA